MAEAEAEAEAEAIARGRSEASSNPEVRHRAQTRHAAGREREIERKGRRIQSSHNEEHTPAPSQGPCVSLCSLWHPGSFLRDLSGWQNF